MFQSRIDFAIIPHLIGSDKDIENWCHVEGAMGREAECKCQWSGSTADVKALLEPPELILRGGIRRKIPYAEMRRVRVQGEGLRFAFEGKQVVLRLGKGLATKWAHALLTPPPSLAKKLGITADSAVRMVGAVDDEALRCAVATAKAVKNRDADLILARVNTPEDLSAALTSTATELRAGVPIWFVYRKGKGHPLNQSLVRSRALATGIVDTKVASVSTVLTAMRFVKRRR